MNKINQLITELEIIKKFILVMKTPALDYNEGDLQKDKFLDYNAALLAKFCLLLQGAEMLTLSGNYFSAAVVNRALLEIYFCIRFFHKDPAKLSDYVFLSKKAKDKDELKKIKKIRGELTFKRMIDATHPSNEAKELYGLYSFLCVLAHPSKDPSLLIGSSSAKKVGNVVMGLTEFEPTPNDDFRTFHMLAYTFGISLRMIYLENEILKNKLKKEYYGSIKKYSKGANKFFEREIRPEYFKDTGAKNLYLQLRKKRLEELSKDTEVRG